jgi:hypothetical protein
MADALRGNIDAVEQDVLVLGPVLLKYISDAFVCDGQVKTDTELSNPGQPLEVIGTDIPQI